MAKKVKTAYFCKECGYESPKWLGKCPSCGEWNTFVEEKIIQQNSRTRRNGLVGAATKPMKVSEIPVESEERITLPSNEFNRVLGGGLVKGSIVLIGGEPGIGKSTLILQNVLSIRRIKILYVSGEESASQLKMRANRLGKVSDNVYILCDTSLESILEAAEGIEPGLLVVDSIQTVASDDMESSAGSIGQVRECTARLLRYAKETGVPVLLVGHINKDGAIAGPKVLEHIVDAVLQFEGDRQFLYRLLRPIKNRFGSTSEIGIYEMAANGLREILNPSEMLLSRQEGNPMSGTSTGVTVEGVRPMMIEVQSLVSTAAYGTPQRSVTGFDPRRLNMLLAVLEKRAGFQLARKDVFLNITGGFKVADPAVDLAVVAAVMSSNFDISIGNDDAFTGEVGLSGEIRPITRIEQRVAEAAKLGYKRIYIPSGNLKGQFKNPGIEIIECSRIEELFRNIFS